MGEAFDADRYRMAVEISQLVPDLELLPNGDRTEIGDRGVTLSGGQKQRVSIARAVYSDADVYLFDDPLSAVDSHVGRALFEKCIRGVLRNKTVILVTNALQYLPSADNILWMEGGAVKAQGSYSQLVAAGMNVAELVHVEHEAEQTHQRDEDPSRQAGTGVVAEEADLPDDHDSTGTSGTDSAYSDDIAKATIVSHDDADGDKAARHVKGSYIPEGKPSKSITLRKIDTVDNRNLTGIEARETGAVSGKVLKSYIIAGGGFIIIAFVALLFAAEQGARVFTDTWVGLWFGDAFRQNVWFYVGIYAALGILYSFLTFLR